MNYFTSIEAARNWATSYGLPYPFQILSDRRTGMYVVRFEYRDPPGC